MKFFHIADTHLGAIPDAGFAWSEERRSEIWESFRSVVAKADREEVDLLLIAGDLFHRQPLMRELKEVNYLFSTLKKRKGVRFMSNTSTKKKFGFFAVIVAAVLCLAAGAYYKYVNGYFGLAQSSHKDNFSPVVFWLLIGGAVVCALCIALKKYGLASAVVTAASGVSIALFVHKCYWYVVDVLYGIDEKQFDPKFFTFVGLMVAAFVVSEISLYTKKTA